MRTVCFVDTETTGLGPTRKVWEVAVIRRVPGHEDKAFTILVSNVDLRNADPKALEIGRFEQRHRPPLDPDSDIVWKTENSAAHMLLWALRDATVVGAQPHFDTETLRMMFDRQGLDPAWHYRLRDVESMTAGHLRRDVGGLAGCMEALGLPFDKHVQHTAMGDAQAVRAIYDKIMGMGPAGS